jgi:hypothetical protein
MNNGKRIGPQWWLPKNKGCDGFGPTQLQAQPIGGAGPTDGNSCGTNGSPIYNAGSCGPRALGTQSCWNIGYTTGDGPLGVFNSDESVWSTDWSTIFTNNNPCMNLQPNQTTVEQCCLGNKTGFASCQKRYCPTSPACVPTLSYYCSQPANVTTDVCQGFCSQNSNKPWCDHAMKAFCANSANAGNRLCACINSPVSAPSCFDPNCTGSYQTVDMITQAENCPAFCGAIIQCITEGNCNVHDIDIKAKCAKASPQVLALVEQAATLRRRAQLRKGPTSVLLAMTGVSIIV